MLNTLDDYICRSISDSEPFSTNPNLAKKVDEKGNIEYIYPQTLASQVIMNERGERLNTILNENLLWLGDTGDEGVESIDADTLKGQTAGYYKTAYNLLDNSDFRNPVNQRGATSYSGDWIYTIDRWQTSDNNPILSVVNGGVKITTSGLGYIYQRLEKVKAGKYTFAVKFRGNNGVIGLSNIKTDQSVIPDISSVENSGLILLNFEFTDSDTSSSNNYQRIAVTNGEAVIEWAALYEGEYTAETLPTYMPKGYANELLECMRYCYVLPEIDGAHCYSGFSDSATNARITINLPIALRSTPTISIGNNSENDEVYTSSGSKKITSISVRGNDRNGLVLNCTTSGLTAWSNCTARFMNMIISADL